MPPSIGNITDSEDIQSMVSRIRSDIPKGLQDILQDAKVNIQTSSEAAGKDSLSVSNTSFTNSAVSRVLERNGTFRIYSNSSEVDIIPQRESFHSITVQEQVVIGACVTVGLFVIIALLLRILMPICRKKLKDEYINNDTSSSGELIKSDSSLNSSQTSSSRGSSNQLASSSSNYDWSDSNSGNTGSTYFSRDSREFIKEKLGSLASVSSSSLSLPNLSSSKTRLTSLIQGDSTDMKQKNTYSTDNESTSGVESLSSASVVSDVSGNSSKKLEVKIFYINPELYSAATDKGHRTKIHITTVND